MQEKNIVINKRARYDYQVLERYEAGIELKGAEVKSLRLGKVSLKDSYCKFKDGELFIFNLKISPFQPGNRLANFKSDRPRKLLLHRYELDRLLGKLKSKGGTIIPLRLYMKGKYIKLEIAWVKAKRKYDKRQELRRREMERQLRREAKLYRL